MDLHELLDLYKQDERTHKIVHFTERNKTKHLHLKGLAGSSDAIVASVVANEIDCSHLFILNDKEEAAYFLNNLEHLASNRLVLFFPASYKKPYQIEDIDNANILQRAEVLNRITKTEKGVLIVSYPEALNEKVVTRKNLDSNTIDIHLGEKLSVDFIISFLNDYEFERTDFVMEAGEFSVRGGIVDIYSFANELPYRIEFSGDTVESIRTFNPSDQLSEQKLSRITIIPNVQTRLLKESRESFFDFIKEDTLIWTKDLSSALEYIEAEYEKVTMAYEETKSLVSHLPPKDLFENKERILEKINGFRVVEFGRNYFYQDADTVDFNIVPQPSFNKNFDLLTETLTNNTKKRYHNFIFADAAKQIERLYAIFADIGKNIDCSPILLSLHEGFIDHDLKVACYTDHQIFDRYHRFRLKQSYTKSEALTLREIYNLKPGDYVTHIDHGVGRFAGLEKIEANGKTQEAIRLIYKDDDILYVSIHSLHRIAKYSGKDGTIPTMNKLGTAAWSNLKQKTKKKVKDIAKDLIALYAKRKQLHGFAFSPDTYLQNELEASFIYEDTKDQVKATVDVKRDMELPMPMDRLICGDVGFGKTEIAIRAAFKAVTDSKQVAILVPTTILALQHYNTFKERMKDFPCTVDYINRFKTAKQQAETLKRLAEGKLDIVIGTHRILSKDIKFKDLGLLIIDEEQKFGVASKEKIKAIRVNVDTLTLTATPIPRTLQFSLMGARDLSIINTPPPNRYPVQTEVHAFNETIIRDAVRYEIDRGGQVFFVHNRIQDIHEVAGLIKRLCPDASISVGHGQMDGEQLEDTLMSFIEGDVDILVSTTIIESGLDISNANTIIINQAQNFGLSDLHQMRGRVGRSNKKSFCYLLTPPLSVLTPEAKQRLKAIEEFSELGSGFNISMRDLDIRGAGNLLGGEQSGFISEIGFEMYHKILDEAIQELKETDFKDLFAPDVNSKVSIKYVHDCVVDTDMEILIPDEYVSNIKERVSLYKDIDDIETEEKLKEFEKNLVDRFGALPKEVKELLNTVRLRWMAINIGFEKIVLTDNRLNAYFISSQLSPYYKSEIFNKVILFVQNNPRLCKMRERTNKLSISFEGIRTIDEAIRVLKNIENS